MKQCKAINTVTAAMIISVANDSVQLEGVEDPVVVSKNWINHQLPQPGDYLVSQGEGYFVLKPHQFDAQFVFDDLTPADDLTPGE